MGFLDRIRGFQDEADLEKKLLDACRAANLSEVQKLAKRLKRIECLSDFGGDLQPIEVSSQAGDLSTVSWILSNYDVDLSQHEYRAIRLAIKEDHFEVYNLLQSKCDASSYVSVNNYSVLKDASANGSFQVLKHLLEVIPPLPEQVLETMFYHSVHFQHPELSQYLFFDYSRMHGIQPWSESVSDDKIFAVFGKSKEDLREVVPKIRATIGYDLTPEELAAVFDTPSSKRKKVI